LLLVLLLLAIPVLLFSWYFASNYYYDRDYRNQQRIAEAYISYTRAKNVFPQSLADLVKTGYLPAEAYYYKRNRPGRSGVLSISRKVVMWCSQHKRTVWKI